MGLFSNIFGRTKPSLDIPMETTPIVNTKERDSGLSYQEYVATGGWDNVSSSVGGNNSWRIPAVYRSIALISETIATLPFNLLELKDNGNKFPAKNHHAYKIYKSEPNRFQTWFDLKLHLVSQALTYGNGYAYIRRDRYGKVLSFEHLSNGECVPYYIKTGNKHALYYYVFAEMVEASDIIHIKCMGSDGVIGRNPIEIARDTINAGISQQEFTRSLYDKGLNLQGALKHPSTLSTDAQRRLKYQMDTFRGSRNSSGTILLEEGLEYQAISIKPIDAQFIESRKFTIEDISRMYGVPLHKLNELSKCVSWDTLIYTTKGNVYARDIQVGDTVWSSDGINMMPKKVVDKYDNGDAEVFEVKTTNRAIKCTSNHRLWVLREVLTPSNKGGKNIDGKKYNVSWEKKWVMVSEMEIGDTLITLKNTPSGVSNIAPNGRDLTIGFMEFCGLLIGDGNVHKTKGKPTYVSIYRADNASYMDYYKGVIKKEFVSYSNGTQPKYLKPIELQEVNFVEGVRVTRFSSVLAASELTELGFSGTAFTKRVPSWVYGLTDELKLAFLRGFLDADGTVDKKGRITMYSANYDLINDLRHLCMGLGIPVTNARYDDQITEPPFTKNVVKTRMHRFTCSDPSSNMRIGSHDKRYVERFLNSKGFSKKDRNYPRFGGKDFSGDGLSLARITSIESVGVEKVYDIEVEDTHMYFGNGVASHNSTNNNIEHQDLEFYKNCINPWEERIEQEFDRKVLLDKDKGFYKHEFDNTKLLRTDTKARMEWIQGMFSKGAITPNEIRVLEGLNAIDNEKMDETYMQLAMSTVDNLEQNNGSETKKQDGTEDKAA